MKVIIICSYTQKKQYAKYGIVVKNIFQNSSFLQKKLSLSK